VSEEKDACLPPEHFENSTLMMVREAWVISAQMRGNLCTRFFFWPQKICGWAKKKRKEKEKTSATVVSLLLIYTWIISVWLCSHPQKQFESVKSQQGS